LIEGVISAIAMAGGVCSVRFTVNVMVIVRNGQSHSVPEIGSQCRQIDTPAMRARPHNCPCPILSRIVHRDA